MSRLLAMSVSWRVLRLVQASGERLSRRRMYRGARMSRASRVSVARGMGMWMGFMGFMMGWIIADGGEGNTNHR